MIAQEADVLPERTATGMGMSVGDSDEGEVEGEIDIGDRASDGADAMVGLEQTAVVNTMVGLGKTMENADIGEVCNSLDTLQRSLQALNTGDESESEAPTSVAERVEVIEERIVPPPQSSVTMVGRRRFRALWAASTRCD